MAEGWAIRGLVDGWLVSKIRVFAECRQRQIYDLAALLNDCTQPSRCCRSIAGTIFIGSHIPCSTGRTRDASGAARSLCPERLWGACQKRGDAEAR